MDPCTWLWIAIVKCYLEIYEFCLGRLGVQLRGLGFALRRIKRPFVFQTGDRKFYFEPEQAAAYSVLMVNPYPELETHLFLHRLVESHVGSLTFIDVGASIGEFVIDLAGLSKVTRVVAFEPQAASARAICRSARLNDFVHVEVVAKIIGEGQTQLAFVQDHRSPTAAHIAEASEQSVGVMLPCSTLDEELRLIDGPVAVLIDVEGAEANVIQGAQDFILRTRPLIVFEYYRAQREKFSLLEFRELLGPGYTIFRLRGDGYLDRSFDVTWNCVAVADDSPLYPACQSSFSPAVSGSGAKVLQGR